MSKTNYGNFEDIVAMANDSLKPIVIALKEIILELDPNTYETVRLGDRAATYGVGSKKMKEGYVYIMPHKSWVNLGFYQGAMLNDTYNILEGTGKKLRHIKVRALNDDIVIAIKDLVRLAIEERRNA